jgi:hypothetical protein
MRHTCLASVMVGDDGWDQRSPQAVQTRPGPLGLAWLAGLVGLVLAPSGLGSQEHENGGYEEEALEQKMRTYDY